MAKTIKAVVSLSGCDDDTIFFVDATKEQLAFLISLASQSVSCSEYGCQPVLIVSTNPEQDKYMWREAEERNA